MLSAAGLYRIRSIWGEKKKNLAALSTVLPTNHKNIQRTIPKTCTIPFLSYAGRLASLNGQKAVVDDLVKDLFKKMSQGKVLWLHHWEAAPKAILEIPASTSLNIFLPIYLVTHWLLIQGNLWRCWSSCWPDLQIEPLIDSEPWFGNAHLGKMGTARMCWLFVEVHSSYEWDIFSCFFLNA